uniref:AMP-dependent synthetase/ligase domain-containing protein n=1 Tax=Ditylum brightwellii TaxID=49249 RepID=A0A7S1VYX9_9STRA|mmetsp:Transcript_10632/g.15792  ORF Transcript_10632/g.15792 Transcript_10632/m.15792 type:complete len:813 (+) Transcript_10632:108-2546(+)
MINRREEKGASLSVSTPKMLSLFFILVSSSLTSAFVTPLSSSKSSLSLQKRSFGDVSASGSFGLLHMATVEEEMDTNDEAVLFGEGGAVSSRTPSARKSSPSVSRTEGTAPALNTLDHSNTDPLINKLRTMRNNVQSCPAIWSQLAKDCPNLRALYDAHLCDEKVDYTFKQMNEIVQKSARVFHDLGVTKGVNVAILGENSAQWLVADHGIQLAGGASAVRGADAPAEELRYIYEHSDSKNIAVLQGPRLLQKLAKDAEANSLTGLGLKNEYGSVKTILLMHREKKSDDDLAAMSSDLGVTIRVLADVINAASPLEGDSLPTLTRDDLATIVYTSGTTGRPKGVMLTHGNLLHQINHRIYPTVQFEDAEPIPGDVMLSLLPVWHITERTFELWILSRGSSVVYTSIRHFKNDLAKHQPQWMVLVPRVLEKVAMGVQDKFASGSAVAKTLVKLFTKTGTIRDVHRKVSQGLVVSDKKPSSLSKLKSKLIVTALAPINAVGNKLVWSKVQNGFGGKQKAIISGGSALAGALESFYELCSIKIMVGYGLTECSPLIAFRRGDENLVTAGCVGKATSDTELRVVNPEIQASDESDRKALPDGEVGVVIARGPQVMKGYYKNPEATAKAIDQYGWFDTGDLGRINPATGDLILTGRCKDTIVLSNGENIEPSPIEDAILSESSLIEQVMLIGQDGRSLTAIAVLTPNELVNAGYIDAGEGKRLQKANEKVNLPNCSEEECGVASDLLNEAAKKLRNNASLNKAVLADMKEATKPFRAWEQVSNVYLTLEPFAMANGLLTQSYKVKRDFVVKRYEDEL